MIGPVSSTGRAMMASLQQAIQKGMPPDQAVQYVKSMATQGVAPLADLYVMMNQFQRLKQQPAQAPQTPPTIRDQLNMMSQPQPAPQMAPPQMAQGLGGMDAGRMENPGFAGGGIVAFQQGGQMPQKPVDYTDPQQQMALLGSQYGLGMSESDFINKEMAEEEEIAKRYGLGRYGEAYKARRQQVADLQSEMGRQKGEDRRMDQAEFFFNVAAAAAKPGATLFSSLAEAGPGLAKAARATNERLRALQAQAREAQTRLLEADELQRAGYLDAARKRHAEGASLAIEVGSKINQIRSNEKVASIYTTPRGVAAVEARLAGQIEKDPNLSPAQKLESVRGLGKRASADTQLLRTKLTGIDRRITETEKALALPQAQMIPELKQSLEARRDELIAERASILSENPELGAGAAATPAGAQGVTSDPRLPYANMPDDEIRKRLGLIK